MDDDLEGKLLKAKVELMTRSAFISTIALSVKHVFSDKCLTADVSGTRIRYNPDFIRKQTTAQFAGLIAHECWHIAFQHLARRGNKNHIIWNCAGDYIINYMLTKAGFEIPTGGLYDKKYTDEWTTDSVYADLIANGTEFEQNELMLDLVDGGPDGNDDGSGTGSGQGVLSKDSAITNIIVRARTQAQMAGKAKGEIPAEIHRQIEELLNPKLPWPVILNRFLDQKVREEYSWTRRNRRYLNDYMPSLYSNTLGHLTFAIDTSGSIGDEELQEMLSEIKGIQQVFKPNKMTIIDCDSEIHEVYEIDADIDILSLKFHGGGGTSFMPVLEYIEDHPTQALIYFTDLYGEEHLDPVDYPILWICTSNHEPASIGETVYVNNYCSSN